jgi:hypothetical protein
MSWSRSQLPPPEYTSEVLLFESICSVKVYCHSSTTSDPLPSMHYCHGHSVKVNLLSHLPCHRFHELLMITTSNIVTLLSIGKALSIKAGTGENQCIY